jgi:hypothetical protein
MLKAYHAGMYARIVKLRKKQHTALKFSPATPKPMLMKTLMNTKFKASLADVIAYLKLTPEEWATINHKRQDQLFIRAEKEMRKAQQRKAKVK